MCAYRARIALLETLHCLYGDPTSFLLNVYANAELRRTLILCACSNCATSHGVLDDPTATNKDTVALLRRYERLYLRISEERSRIIDLGSEMTVCARNQTTVHTSSTLWTRSGNPNHAIIIQFSEVNFVEISYKIVHFSCDNMAIPEVQQGPWSLCMCAA